MRRPTDSSSALALSQNTLQRMFVDVQKRFKNSIFLRLTASDNRFTPKISMHSLITSFDPVLNNFIKHLVKTKSRECLSVALTGHASSPYKITGMHFITINLMTTSSEAILPTLPKTELNERK